MAGGLLLLVGGLAFAVPVLGPPTATLLAYPVGAVVLLGASIVLAAGSRGEDGLVGPGRGMAAALVGSASLPLLLLVAYASSWSSPRSSALVFPVLQLVVLVATAGVALTVARLGRLGVAARRGFAALAVLDAVAFVLAVVPAGLLAYQVAVAGVRPIVVVVVVVGVLLALDARRAGTSADD